MPEPVLHKEYQVGPMEELRRAALIKVPILDAKGNAIGERYANPLLQAATGWGKTHGFTFMAYHSHHKGNSCWIAAHLKEILESVAARFTYFGIPFSWIASGKPEGDHPTKLVMVQTAKARLEKLAKPRWGMDDEAHRIMAESRLIFRSWSPETRWYGATATPLRGDGRGLCDAYDYMVKTLQIKELIAHNQLDDTKGLVQPITFIPDQKVDFSDLRSNSNGDFDKDEVKLRLEKAKVTGDLVDTYKTHCPGAQAIVFDVDVASAKDTASAFSAAGIPASAIDGSMDEYRRRSLYQGFVNGSIKVLVNVNLFLEGVDIPGVQAVFWRRPTDSLIIWMQGNGRGMRPAPGKKCVLIFDHVGNYYRHGLPDWDRDWDLTGRVKGTRKEAVGKAVTRCERCHRGFDPAPVCPHCGWLVPVKKRELIEVAGQLVMAVDDERLQKLIMREQEKRHIKKQLRKCFSLEDCISLAAELGKSADFGKNLWIQKQAWKKPQKSARL